MRRNSVTPSVAICMLLTIGCGSGDWHQGDLKPQSFSEKDTLTIWSHRRPVRWHSVIVTRDSIVGVLIPLPSDSNPPRRESLPWAEVDSIWRENKRGLPVGPFLVFTAVLAIPIGLLVYLCEHPDENGKKTCLK